MKFIGPIFMVTTIASIIVIKKYTKIIKKYINLIQFPMN